MVCKVQELEQSRAGETVRERFVTVGISICLIVDDRFLAIDAISALVFFIDVSCSFIECISNLTGFVSMVIISACFITLCAVEL